MPAPSIIAPSANQDVMQVSHGKMPDNYQKILKEYLIKNLENYKSAKVEFINDPEKLSIDHLEILILDIDYVSPLMLKKENTIKVMQIISS